jgi:hypothetical protein
VHWTLAEERQDRGPDVTAPGAAGASSFAVLLASVSGSTARAVVVPTAIAVDLGSAAAAAAGVVHVRFPS